MSAQPAFTTPIVTPQRVASMALTMDPFAIAERLSMTEDDVVAMIRRMGGKVDARERLGVCRRTGRTVRGFSERAVYLKAQIAGFADWYFAAPPALLEAPNETRK